MSEEKQLRLKHKELLSDIGYVNEISKKETARILGDLQQWINGLSLPVATEAALMQEISVEIARLAARVEIAESAVQALQERLLGASDVPHAAAILVSDTRTGLARFSAKQMAERKNLWPLEIAPDGRAFCWTGPGPDTTFYFSVDRKSPLELQIFVHAMLKPKYAKHVEISVDGKPVRHRVWREGSQKVLSCLLPAVESHPLTKVGVSVPAMRSPAELGLSQDERKLGMAIHEIRFAEPCSLFSRLSRRFRSKTSVPIDRALNTKDTSDGLLQTDQHQSFTLINAHLTVGNLLDEIGDEIEKQKSRLRHD